MRPDMAKILVERPRIGSRFKTRAKGYRKRWQRTSLDEAPMQESIYRLRGSTRDLNEYLSPLVRFLHQQVGRPWNDVFSEICEHIRLDSAIQKHVRDHLFQYVQTVVEMRGGVPHYASGYRGNIGQPIVKRTSRFHLNNDLFFVCPETGMLCEAPLGQLSSPEQRLPTTITRGEKTYHRADGIWYEIEYIFWGEASPEQWEVNLHQQVADLSVENVVATYNREIVATRRRQLNSRELQRLKLRNDPIA
jgi:hypothetical protein